MTKIATHNGNFHADDVFAVATLLLIYPKAEVIRTRDEEVIRLADIVVDVGFVYNPKLNRFDHHQSEGAGGRDNGIPYSSFGLIWRAYGRKIAGGDDEALLIDKKLVSPIDAIDNGISISENKFPEIREYTIGDLFSSYLDMDEPGEKVLLKKFLESVEVAKGVLRHEINLARKEVSDAREVKETFNKSENKGVIVLDKSLSWHKTLIPKPEVMFVVYPRKTGDWGVRAVPKHLIGFETKKSFPQSWGGKNDQELAEVTGVEDAVFCHKALFLCGAKSKEGAIKLAEIALNA